MNPLKFWLIISIIALTGILLLSLEKPLERNYAPNMVLLDCTLRAEGNAQDIHIEILANKIIQCESGGRPDICSYAGCGAGMGLFQLIPSTIKYCEKKLGKNIDPFDSSDNYECGMWLLREEGWRHWGCPSCNWGSYKCFKEVLTN
ncbi:MAG: lytic transglycosylase domain-containing protein [bacterium]|nr:lytic transglycosylase domain-containing protein [bacterium]